MKLCKICGRKRHSGFCDMATLSDGRVVHVSRIDVGGDLHEEIGDSLKVVNRWLKKDMLDKKKRDKK